MLSTSGSKVSRGGTSSIDDLLGEADLAMRGPPNQATAPAFSSPSWGGSRSKDNSGISSLQSLATSIPQNVSPESAVPRPPSTSRASTNVNPKSRFVSMHPKPLAICDGDAASEVIEGDWSSRPNGAEVAGSFAATSAIKEQNRFQQPQVLSEIDANSKGNSISISATFRGVNAPLFAASGGTSGAAPVVVSRAKGGDFYVDDVLNDLDKVMKPSPTKSFPTSTASIGNRPGGLSTNCGTLPFVGATDTMGNVVLANKNEPSQGSLLNTDFQYSSSLPLAVPVSISSFSSSSDSASSSLFPKPAAAAGANKSNRCTRIVISGAKVPRGQRASAFSKCVCDNLRCVQCNFEVLWFEGRRWAEDADYMFFRNCVPNHEKLKAKLISDLTSAEVAKSCAYCCQCSWTTVQEDRVLGIGTGELQWVCGGHASS